MEPLSMLAFGLFVLMLGGLLLFHHHKIPVVVLGFIALAAIFIAQHDVVRFSQHFADPHRSHLLLNLALMLPGFALVAHYFEHSGASHALARIIRSDALVLWTVFFLSTVLDNIAACMIGGTILLARYGQDAPFSMLIGIIGASNLGGAGSPVGDTTTVMLFVSKDPVVPVTSIFAAFVATIPAMALLTMWAVRHNALPNGHRTVADSLEDASHRLGEDDAGRGHEDVVALAEGETTPGIRWGMVLTLLAIPGLIVGNIMEQPGLGLWAGIGLGLLLGRTTLNLRELWKALPNTFFLCTLVATAELLPLEEAKPFLATLSRDGIAILMGLLSAWFDNIPLTAVCLQLKEFDWGLLAYAVGYGGSAMWFGSSAGVALCLLFKQVSETRRWAIPFLVVTGTYFVGIASYVAVFHGGRWLFSLPRTDGLLLTVCLAFAMWTVAGLCEIGGKKLAILKWVLVGLGVCLLILSFCLLFVY